MVAGLAAAEAIVHRLDKNLYGFAARKVQIKNFHPVSRSANYLAKSLVSSSSLCSLRSSKSLSSRINCRNLPWSRSFFSDRC